MSFERANTKAIKMIQLAKQTSNAFAETLQPTT